MRHIPDKLNFSYLSVLPFEKEGHGLLLKVVSFEINSLLMAKPGGFFMLFRSKIGICLKMVWVKCQALNHAVPVMSEITSFIHGGHDKKIKLDFMKIYSGTWMTTSVIFSRPWMN